MTREVLVVAHHTIGMILFAFVLQSDFRKRSPLHQMRSSSSISEPPPVACVVANLFENDFFKPRIDKSFTNIISKWV